MADAKHVAQPETGDNETRRLLLREASRILESEGYAALSLRSAAKAAGLSPAAPYRHFENGFPEMLAVIAESGFRDLIRTLDDAARSPDSRERIIELCLEYVRFGIDRPDLYRAMFSPQLARPVELRDQLFQAGEISFSSRKAYENLAAVKREAFTALVTPLAEAQRDGSLKAGAPEEFGLALAAMAHGLVGEFIDEGLGVRESQRHPWSKARQAMSRNIVELLLSGLDRPQAKPRGPGRATRSPPGSTG